MSTISKFEKQLAEWREDPCRFAVEALGVQTVTAQARKIMESVRDNPRTVVASCNSSGKTHTASVLTWWHALCFQPSRTIVTGASERQIRDNTMGEVRARHRQARIDIPGEVRIMGWEMPESPLWDVTAFATAADAARDTASKMLGYHSPHVFVIVDEASGVARPIWDAIDSLLASGTCRVLAIGNPLSPEGGFAEAFRSPDWHSITIDALETENLKQGRVVYPFQTSPEWVEMMRRKYGEGSPIFEAKVRGRFPTSSVDTLISMASVQAAFERRAPARLRKPELGCDVARFGDDRTVLVAVDGPEVVEIARYGGQDTMRTAGEILRMAPRLGIPRHLAERIGVDDGGVGGGVVDRLLEQKWNVRSESFGNKARDELRFRNRRTELWWTMKEWIEGEACLASFPPDMADELLADLTTPKYRVESDGRLMLEKKREMKKRLGRSPDLGDALAIALGGRTEVPAFVMPSRPDHRPRRRAGTREDQYDDEEFLGDRDDADFDEEVAERQAVLGELLPRRAPSMLD